MSGYQAKLENILKILQENPKGLTISKIAEQIGMNRNSMARYLDVFLTQGKVEMVKVGPAKIWFPSQRLPMESLMDYTEDLVIVINERNEIVQVNQAFLNFCSMKRDDLAGTNWTKSCSHLADHEKISSAVKKALGGKERTIRRIKLGPLPRWGLREPIFVRVKTLPVRFLDGTNGAALKMEDITAEVQAEEVLRESENWYRTIFEDSPVSLWVEDFSDIKRFIDSLRDSGVKDLRTYFENNPEAVAKCVAMVKVIDVNKATMESYKGRSKEEFYAGLEGVFNEEAYDDFRESLISISEGKPRFETEGISQTLTGEKNHIFIRWTVVPGYEKTWSRVLVSITDITERKAAEVALERSEEKYRAIFENTGTAMVIIEEDHTISLANKEAEKLTGYSREEVLGKIKWMKFVAEKDLERMKKYHRERRKKGGKAPKSYEFKLVTKKRNVRDVKITIDIIPGTKKAVASIIDITGLKREKKSQN